MKHYAVFAVAVALCAGVFAAGVAVSRSDPDTPTIKAAAVDTAPALVDALPALADAGACFRVVNLPAFTAGPLAVPVPRPGVRLIFTERAPAGLASDPFAPPKYHLRL